MQDDSYLKEVRNQYENYPYPARHPEQENSRLVISKSCSLDCINFYGFEGKRDLTKDLRVLVAGGGTGDDIIYLAEQLRDTNAEVVYLDMTAESMSIAKQRAKIRGLNNITWHHDSLLNLNAEQYGQFDFISCTGVLHHLEDPELGLKALTNVLHPKGLMYIMVYATVGRTGVYQMQELMRRVNIGIEDMQEGVENTKTILANLPAGNWFSFNKVSCQQDLASDIGIYDLLLHSQDRAYSVDEMYDFVEGSGLTLNKLYNPDHPLGDLAFCPETYIRDPKLLADIKKMPLRKQQAICELLLGQIMKQCCFVSFENKDQISHRDTKLIPSISTVYTLPNLHKDLLNAFNTNKDKIQLNPMFGLKNSKVTQTLFKLIDGTKSIIEITDETFQVLAGARTKEQIQAEFNILLEIMIKLDMLYLRDAKVPKNVNIQEILDRGNH